MARRTKRTNGDGSTYPRGSGFEAAITVDGERRTARAKTRPEAEAALRRLRALRDTNQLPRREGMTTEAFLLYWLEQRRAELRYSTWRRYKELALGHAVPIVGLVPLVKLSALHLQDLYTRRLNAGLSAQSVLHLHRVLHAALNNALAWDLVDRNVARKVTPPRVRPKEIEVLAPAQVATLIAASKTHPFGALFVLVVTTGLRQSEALGLRWSDLDLRDAKQASVRGSMQRAEKGRVLGETKTEKSRRAVEVLDVARDLLLAQRRHQGALRLAAGGDWAEPDLVFTDDRGLPLNPDRVRRRFRSLLTANDLPPIMFKNLRHTFATLHLDTGTPDMVVSEAMGHTRTNTTNTLYRRVDRRHQQDAAGRLGALLSAAAEAAVAGGVAGGSPESDAAGTAG